MADTLTSTAFFVPGRGVILSCVECSSTGTNPAIRPKRVSNDDNDALLQAHADKVGKVMEAHTSALKALAERKRKGENVDPAIKAQMEGTKAKLAELRTQEPTDQARFIVETCPWCQKPLNVEVQPMPQGDKPATSEKGPG